MAGWYKYRIRYYYKFSGKLYTKGSYSKMKNRIWKRKTYGGVSKYFCEFTCDEDSLLELVKLPGPDAFVIDTAWSLTCLMYSTSLNTFLSPPPGLCFTLSKDPILLCTLTFTFWSMIYQCGGYKEITVRFVHEKIT